MASATALLLLLIAVVLVIPTAVLSQSIIQSPSTKHHHGHTGVSDNGLFCDSWRFTVETNNAGNWSSIPSRCVEFVKDYVIGPRYFSDSAAVAKCSLRFAKAVEIVGDGKDAWVFDIDETLLSNLPYLLANGFESKTDIVTWDEWVELAVAPALPESLILYKDLEQLGFKFFLLTGRSEYQRTATEKNLRFAGYNNWERLILRGPSDQKKDAIVYKSEKRSELINEGYRLHGSSGDQWSDLLGFAVAQRSFKLPNPMYYIP